jgi:arginyl-tRNA--protein-N-Asp/Glu arginylyltransferase
LIVSAPPELPVLGLLVAGGDKCSYFRDDRPACTVYSQPRRPLSPQEYDTALSLGMRRSGRILYRPVCPGCRKCQPFRIDVNRFAPSKSQRRVMRKCEGAFEVRLQHPRFDPEHIDLFARYQAAQHGVRGIDPSMESYRQFLVDSITETVELAWRDPSGKLCAVGILDIVPSGVSTVYFFWDPELRDYSLGTYSALLEIDLCRQWNKPYYYLGYLVPGAETMNYKASFSGGEVWNGEGWVPVGGRGIDDPLLLSALAEAEIASIQADQRRFPILR